MKKSLGAIDLFFSFSLFFMSFNLADFTKQSVAYHGFSSCQARIKAALSYISICKPIPGLARI